MRTSSHAAGSDTAQAALQSMAGWAPTHRSIEAEAAALTDLTERDNAARNSFARRAAQ